MIQANELRIGNYYDHNGIVRQVTPETILDVWESERVWCKPISLTEEWLIRFGFKKFKNQFREFYLNKISIVIDGSIFLFRGSYDEFNIEIKYIHQLQNLIFALTQTELTLKDN